MGFWQKETSNFAYTEKRVGEGEDKVETRVQMCISAAVTPSSELGAAI